MAEFFGLAKKLNKETDENEQHRLAAEMVVTGDLLGLLQSDPEAWFAGHVEGELSAERYRRVLIDKAQRGTRCKGLSRLRMRSAINSR